ncbi:MAG TPA: hypothetical protein VFI61_03180 [Patescibacteria group bacterium]|nr:hypothetical protein [Patescibacteria group bacterium]
MSDILDNNETNFDGIEITLQKDTFVFKKTKENLALRDGVIEKGETIIVGDYTDIVRLYYDHDKHEFTPWMDNPDVIHGDETTVRYIRTQDLPQDF